jgi:hypothetical protein
LQPEGVTASGFYPHELRLQVVEHFIGALRYRAIFLPDDLAARPDFSPARLRFEGELNDHPVSLAWQPAKGGRKYAMLSPALLSEVGAGVGDRVSLRFRLVPDSVVEAPAELLEAIAGTANARARWDNLTPGRQRGLAAMVNTARRPETRQRRSIELAGLLADGAELPGPPKSRKKDIR